ncbi:MAG: DedA family protein [Acidobacteria bacterium]|nr:DedA family protein [Acidobacteriota bacterium]
MPWLSKLVAWVEQILLPWGIWGLAAAAVLDSSFVPFPSGVDLWMITLSVRNPSQAPLYVLIATVGSVVGASILYFAVRKGEEAILGKRVPADKIARVRHKIERSGSWAIVIAALLPPPAPFKLFILAAGLLQFPWTRFALALLVGRAIRYSLEGYLAVRYGHQAWEFLLRAGPWAFGAAALACLLIFLLYRFRTRASSVTL